MDDSTMRMCEEAVKVAAAFLTQRDAAIVRAEKAEKERDDALEAFKLVHSERHTLRERLKDITSKLADAEAKIEAFNAALDTEARR